MKFRKNMKLGVSFIFLLLTLTSCLSLINLTKKNNSLDENTLSLSATVDDYMEDNDSFGNASWVTQNNYTNLMIIESDEDWFQFNLNTGDTIDVEIYFNHSKGDLDLELYDPLGATFSRAVSDSTLDYENLTFTSDVSGAWRIRVYHYTQNTNVSYDLYIWKTHGSGDDWAEENDGYYNATSIDPNYYGDLKIIESDEDWFGVYLDVGDFIDVNIYFNHSEGNLELELYDPSIPTIPRAVSDSIFNFEYLAFTSDVSGDWRIRVYHYDGNTNVSYDLDLWVTPISTTIGDDWAEENDGYYNATWIAPNYYGGLRIIESDEDWFWLYLDPGNVIDIAIYFNHLPNRSPRVEIAHFSSSLMG